MHRAVLLGACALVFQGCATPSTHRAEAPCRIPTKRQAARQGIAWHLVDVTVFSQVGQALNLPRAVPRLLGHPAPAQNLLGGTVPDGAFFTNRNLRELTPEAIRAGPTPTGEIAKLPFVITKFKLEGKSPGFFVTDARGDRYLLKFDSPGFEELLTGAEAVASKLLYGLGYHVPSYEIVRFEPADLQVDPGLMITDPVQGRRPFTRADARSTLRDRLVNGRVRAVASRMVEGEIIGPASFKRFRDCAQVRALKLAYAWVNNTDAKDHNTLLVWEGTRTVGYLIDFGTSLGADAGRHGAKHPCDGWQYLVDVPRLALELFSLGFYRSGCDPGERSFSPAVGMFSPRLNPRRWKPYAPNLAFEELTEAEARWMAKRIALFSREQLEAAVDAGRYSDPRDAARIVEVLLARREAILEAYGITPTPQGGPE